jgi:phage tail P2-like protein
MDLKSLDFLKLQTGMMQKNKDVQGFATALDRQFRELAAQVEKIIIYGNVDGQPEEVLDILAWSFNVSWYDATSPIEVKRQAINEALNVARILGTPAAVEKVVEIYFGYGQVEEWFDYGGDPYHFRIVTNNPDATGAQAALLAKAVEKVKRKSTVLDSVILIESHNMNLYEGTALHMIKKLTIKQVV